MSFSTCTPWCFCFTRLGPPIVGLLRIGVTCHTRPLSLSLVVYLRRCSSGQINGWGITKKPTHEKVLFTFYVYNIFARTRMLRTNLPRCPHMRLLYGISIGRFQYTSLDEADAETPRECEQPDCLIPVENVVIECESDNWTLPPSLTPYPTMAPVMDGTFGPIPTNAPVSPEEVRMLLLVLVLVLLRKGSQRL